MEQQLINTRERLTNQDYDLYIGSTRNKSFIPIWAANNVEFYSIPNKFESFRAAGIKTLLPFLHQQYNFCINTKLVSGISSLVVSNGFLGQQRLDSSVDIHFMICKNEHSELRVYMSHQLVHEEYWKSFYRQFYKTVLYRLVTEYSIPFIIMDKEALKYMFFEQDKLPTFSSFKEMREFEEQIPDKL